MISMIIHNIIFKTPHRIDKRITQGSIAGRDSLKSTSLKAKYRIFEYVNNEYALVT